MSFCLNVVIYEILTKYWNFPYLESFSKRLKIKQNGLHVPIFFEIYAIIIFSKLTQKKNTQHFFFFLNFEDIIINDFSKEGSCQLFAYCTLPNIENSNVQQTISRNGDIYTEKPIRTKRGRLGVLECKLFGTFRIRQKIVVATDFI